MTSLLTSETNGLCPPHKKNYYYSKFPIVQNGHTITITLCRVYVVRRCWYMLIVILNPRTDGGPGHLSTDGGGRITAPPGDLENEAS